MSTISTHLNWGASYVVNDFYQRFIKKDATEKQLVNIGRLTTVLMMFISGVLALNLTNVKQVFDIIIMFGAGTGLLFILRWFWWRINAWSEISAMFASGIISILLNFTTLGTTLFGATSGILPTWFQLPFVVLITTAIWLIATFTTQPDTKDVLYNFYAKIQPGGPGWNKIIKDAALENINLKTNNTPWSVPAGILAILLSCVLIYSCLFATGFFIYGELIKGILLSILMIISGILLIKVWQKIKSSIL
jgi:Na+/proline symporter